MPKELIRQPLQPSRDGANCAGRGAKTEMRRFILACGLALAASPAAAADEPIGDWAVANGHAHVRIDNCGGALWGAISWEERPGGRDTHNPDPAKRNRPTLGMPILLHMSPTEPNRWEGEVYNAEDGRTYSASISLLGPNTLHIEGCVLGFLCGGEDWTRIAPEPPQATQAPASRPPAAAGRTLNGAARGGAAPSPGTSGAGRQAPAPSGPSPDVCSSVVDLPGRPH
jgi:uncharacterized protein (DUF2147 family)